MEKTIELSIIIVNYNTKDLTIACLESIKHAKKSSDRWEVIVVDNASSDGTMESLAKMQKQDGFYKNAQLITNAQNLGFAKANNIGIRKSKGAYVLLLNSDTEVSEDSIQTMLQFMDNHASAGASTCRLNLPSGAMDPACHRGFPTPWAALTYLSGLERLFPKSKTFSHYHLGFEDITKAHQVDCISGAFFLIRRGVIDQVGLLDEEYFMYAEDIDWAYRVKKHGWEIWFNPEVSILHKKKQSGRSNILRKRRVITEIYFHEYNWLFYKKHYARIYNPVITFFINTFYTVRLFLLKRFSV